MFAGACQKQNSPNRDKIFLPFPVCRAVGHHVRDQLDTNPPDSSIPKLSFEGIFKCEKRHLDPLRNLPAKPSYPAINPSLTGL